MKRIATFFYSSLLLVALFAPVAARAQDTTCNAGDIAWVKETVDADVGHTTGTTGAEYNNFAAPFGIQRVFDQACAGLDIRILAGSDNYGLASASWNNRDNANKQLNIDTVAGTFDNFINVSVWTNETTRGPGALDFEKASITGALGLNITVGFYIFRDLRVTDSDSHAVSLSASGAVTYWFFCEFDNAGGQGLNVQDGGSAATVFQSRSHHNASHGVGGFGSMSILQSEFDNNGGDGINNWGASAGIPIRLSRNLFHNNTGNGIHVRNSNRGAYVDNNTSVLNGGSGLLATSDAANGLGLIVLDNILAFNGDWGFETLFDFGDTMLMLSGNNYHDNVSGPISSTAGIYINLDVPPDETNPDFTGGLQPAPGTVDFTFTFPSGTESADTKGAAHSAGGGAGGGANVAY